MKKPLILLLSSVLTLAFIQPPNTGVEKTTNSTPAVNTMLTGNSLHQAHSAVQRLTAMVNDRRKINEAAAVCGF